MMNKRTLYTVMGVALSFAIAVGGWSLTESLIKRKSNALLSATGVTQIYLPPEEVPAALPVLSEPEIASILRNWESPGSVITHEPVEGQISMEQAITEARAGLALLAGQGLQIGVLLDYSARVAAYLGHNILEGQTGQPIDPAYSYWLVTFANEELRAALVINAVTGQVWNMLVASPSLKVELDVVAVDQILSAYLSYLELTGDEKQGLGFDRNTLKGYVSVGGGSLYAFFESVGRATQDKLIDVAEFTIGISYAMPFESGEVISPQTVEELTT